MLKTSYLDLRGIQIVNIYLLSADNLYKQFGSRSGQTNVPGLIWIQTV